MIYEILSTALLACCIGAGNYKNEPKRANTPSFYGGYVVFVNYASPNGNVSYGISSPNQSNSGNLDNWGTESSPYTVSLTTDFISASFGFYQMNNWETLHCSIAITLVTDGDERREESYFLMQGDQTYSVGDDLEINEFNFEYEPEIYLDWVTAVGDWTSSTFSMTLKEPYKLTFETFGTTESNSSVWVSRASTYSKVFNGLQSGYDYLFFLDPLRAIHQVSASTLNNIYDVSLTDGYDSFFARQLTLTISDIVSDATYKVSAVPRVDGLRGSYDDGYSAGLQEGQHPVSWVRSVFGGLAAFFSIEVFPYVSLGFLAFSPLLVVAIIAIVRIFRHD